MEWVYLAIFVASAFLAGSINTSILVCRIAGKGDVRRVGSGNPGATNTMRLLGRGWAVVVLLIDGGRGAACYLLADWLIPGAWQPFAGCLGLVLGNLFPVFHGFRGGKGVATTLGLYFAIDPLSAGIGLLVWLGIAFAFRYASLGSLCLVVSFPVSLAVRGAGWGAVGFGCLMILVIAFTHRQNIGRLIRGQEHKIGTKKEESE